MKREMKKICCLLQVLILMVVMAGCQQKTKKQEDAKEISGDLAKDENSNLTEDKIQDESNKPDSNGTGDVFQTLGIQDSEISEDCITLVFNVNLTAPLPEGTSLSMGSDLNYWVPMDENWVAQKLDDTHYQLVKTLNKEQISSDSDAMQASYKWTLQDDTLNEKTMWDMVEISEENNSMDNRTTDIHTGKNVITNTVYGFKEKDKDFSEYKYSNVHTGEYETVTLTAENLQVDTQREVYIWVPESYDPKDKETTYPVLYMHDGLGLFDEADSMNGEWQIDEAITDCMENGYGGCIVVGIASSSNRGYEMTPTFCEFDGQGEYYAQFIVNVVKPYIDSHYNTKPDRENTGIGGCSMGGLESLYMGLKYPEVFGFELNFSPCLLDCEEAITRYMDQCDFTSQPVPRIFLYAGGVSANNDLEAYLTHFPDFVKDNLVKRGYPEENINTLIDMTQAHENSAWAKYFPVAFKWLVGIEEE